MKIPTIHDNGTPKAQLLLQIERAHTKLGDALKALAEMAPNARDYYPQGPDAFYAATDEHQARMEPLRKARADLEAMTNAIFFK